MKKTRNKKGRQDFLEDNSISKDWFDSAIERDLPNIKKRKGLDPRSDAQNDEEDNNEDI